MILILKEYFKILCKICYKILNHFIIINESSTFNMIKHFKINAYRKRKRFDSLSQLKITFNRVSLI